MLCSRVFRSSVPSSIPPRRHGPGGRHAFVPLAMPSGGSSGVLGGRSQRARAVRASDLDGVVLTLAQAALAALGPVRSLDPDVKLTEGASHDA